MNTPQDTSFRAAKNHRYVYRTLSIAQPPTGAFVIFWQLGENDEWVVWGCALIGLAIVERWREDQDPNRGPDTYIGPHFLNEIMPVFQDAEGVIHPYNEDPSDLPCHIIVTSCTTEAEIHARVFVNGTSEKLASLFHDINRVVLRHRSQYKLVTGKY